MTDRRGSALVMVLWVLSVLTLVAGFYAVEARIRRNLGQNVWDGLQGREMLRSVLLFCRARLASGDITASEALAEGQVLADGTTYTMRPRGREVTFQLEDEGGKLDLNQASEDEIREVLRGILGDEETQRADTIADGILDWRDPDNLVRLNGAEDEVYEERRPLYRPANGPFRLIEELLLINGVSQSLYYGPLKWASADNEEQWSGGLQNLFTVYNKSAGVVRRYAPLPLTRLLGDTLREGASGEAPLRLRLRIGTLSYQVIVLPQAQGAGFQVVHGGEALMVGGEGVEWPESEK